MIGKKKKDYLTIFLRVTVIAAVTAVCFAENSKVYVELVTYHFFSYLHMRSNEDYTKHTAAV